MKELNSADISRFRQMVSQATNVVVLSHTSPDGDAIGSSVGVSRMLNKMDKQHGFFTYYLLKTLRENMGDIELGQLFDEIKDAVSFESSLQGKQQIPTIIFGGKAKDTWRKNKLK